MISVMDYSISKCILIWIADLQKIIAKCLEFLVEVLEMDIGPGKHQWDQLLQDKVLNRLQEQHVLLLNVLKQMGQYQ